MRYFFLLLLFSYCGMTLSKPSFDIQIQEVTRIIEDDEPLYFQFGRQVLKTDDAIYILPFRKIGGIVYKLDKKGKVIERIGQREFNRGPKMVSEIQLFEDQLLVNTRAELIFYDKNGDRTKTLRLGNKMASSVAMIDHDTAILADYDSRSVPETWHYKLEFKGRKKTYFGDRPQAIYKALNKPRVPRWGNSKAYLINGKFWFVQGYGSTIFIYDLDGKLEKRVHAPIFDAIMVEDIEYREVVRNYESYMLGTSRTMHSLFDGHWFYQYMQRPGVDASTNMISLNIFNPDGELLAYNLTAKTMEDQGLMFARGAGNGELYSWVSSHELEDDEPLIPALQKLAPYLENPDVLRQDGTFIVTFKIALDQPAAP